MPSLTAQLFERLAMMVPRRRHHECVYPTPDGEGGAGGTIVLNTDANDKTNATASTRYYWGESKVVVPVSTLTAPYYFIGAYLTLTAAGGANTRFHGRFYRMSIYNRSVKSGGNDWDEGEVDLTVADGSEFVADDLVWVVSSGHTDGEIQRVASVAGDVVTVERETSQFGAANTGLRWDHTTDGDAEIMYLCERMTDAQWHRFVFEFEAETARRTQRYTWGFFKAMCDNSGVIARILNQTDSANSREVEVKIIYNHA